MMEKRSPQQTEHSPERKHAISSLASPAKLKPLSPKNRRDSQPSRECGLGSRDGAEQGWSGCWGCAHPACSGKARGEKTLKAARSSPAGHGSRSF